MTANNTENRIAVIIVNYNGGDYLAACLQALTLQLRPADRIIVVDNNSSDGSNRLHPDANSSGSGTIVELLQLSQNTGFAAANNRAFEHLNDVEWVALLNPDTLPSESWLAQLESAVLENPDCDIFASKLVSADNPEIIDGAGDVYHVSGLCWRRHHGMAESDERNSNDPVFSGCGAATLFRLDKVRDAGGFDETYFCYFEDVDLAFRMRLYGSRCYYAENSVVNHHGSALTGRDSDFTIYHGHRNLVWTFVKNMPGISFYLYLPQHLLLNLVSLLHYSLKGRAKVIFRAKWHACKGLSSIIRERKRVQSMRSVDSAEVTRFMVKGVFRPYLARFR